MTGLQAGIFRETRSTWLPVYVHLWPHRWQVTRTFVMMAGWYAQGVQAPTPRMG